MEFAPCPFSDSGSSKEGVSALFPEESLSDWQIVRTQ